MDGHEGSTQITALFTKPSVEGLRALTQDQLHQFVAFVFARAGYDVHSRALGFISDIDLDLFSVDGKRSQVGVIAIRHDSIAASSLEQLVRKLQHSPPVRKGGASVYVVSTGDFDEAARIQAKRSPRTYLLTGEQFCRYARYVRNSRFPEGIGLTVVIPPDQFVVEVSSLSTAQRARVLVLANNKGGVGKTTSCRQFALSMARQGMRVLLIDMDPQQNLTEGLLAHTPGELASTVADGLGIVRYFAGQGTLAEMVRPTAIEDHIVNGVFLIPSHPDLSLLDTGGAGRPALEMRFQHDVSSLAYTARAQDNKPFDWVIIDTPPAISLFTRTALSAADFVVTPARSRPSSLRGIENMLKTMDTIGELRGRAPHLIGCLLTHWQEDQHSTETYPRLDTLFANRRSRILASYIPFDVTVEKTHGPTQHRASDAYERATKEVLDYVRHV